MKAIIYESNTGFTKQYAELLSKEIGLPCCALEEADGKVKKGDEVIFLGWIMAGQIKGLKKAVGKYGVRAAAGVGMIEETDTTLSNMKKQNNLGNIPAFYLRGGCDINKLHGLYKFMFKTAAKAMSGKSSNGKANESFEAFDGGGSFVSVDNLRELIDWYKENR